MSDEKGLSALVASHAVWLSAFLRGLTRCEADAEDAFQDVWARIARRGGIPSGANARAYLARTARSAVVDRYRREWRLAVSADAPDGTGVTPASSLVDESPRPDVRVERAATREDVIAAVRALPVRLREVVLMRIEGEMKFQEIADELGVPLGTVLTWMRTATERLKDRLGVGHGRMS